MLMKITEYRGFLVTSPQVKQIVPRKLEFENSPILPSVLIIDTAMNLGISEEAVNLIRSRTTKMAAPLGNFSWFYDEESDQAVFGFIGTPRCILRKDQLNPDMAHEGILAHVPIPNIVSPEEQQFIDDLLSKPELFECDHGPILVGVSRKKTIEVSPVPTSDSVH